MSADNEEVTMTKFLLSKEGRGTLITVVIVIALTLGVGYYVWGSIFSGQGNDRPTAENLAGKGSTTVSTRGQRDMTADLTSNNMTEEARTIARKFNDKTVGDDSLHPIPTADDIQFVDVPGIPKNTDADSNKSELEQATKIKPLDTYQAPPGVPTVNGGYRGSGQANSTERDQLRQRQISAKELARARLEAASGVIQIYQQPPTSGSMAFSQESKDDNGGDKLARVAMNDKGETSFQGSEKEQQATECEYPVVKGGDIRYAVNAIALNTDFEGPVKVEFLDGDLKGWIGMGSFELNEFGAKMKVTVERLIDPVGGSHEATGYVLDPETTLWAAASDVDYHIIYRYGGYGLGTVLAGFTELAEARKVRSERVGSNGDVQTEYREPDGKQITWTLLGAFSELWEKAFKDNINRPITVTLAPDEELGVLFEDSVCISKTDPAYQLIEVKQIRRQGFSDPVK